MEDDTRRLQPVSIGMASIETGKERYTVDGISTSPSYSPWRNNVTALSQRHNLYFAASRQNIIVFRPQFPYQRLGSTPSLVITPTLANESAGGYIDPTNPHAINHIIIGDLGREEILLVARDSGNIEAYHTRAIKDAVAKEPDRFSRDRRSDYVGLRAFFCQWVFESAWGLAIHKEARMIAVSANIPNHIPSDDSSAKITVFAFALTAERDQRDAERNDDEDATEVEWKTWTPPATPQHQAAPSRNRNYKIVLDQGHADNIPSISFTNNDDDRAGTLLFSTDIAGNMIAWNIWQNEIINSWKTTPNPSDESPLQVRWARRGESMLHRNVARRIDGLTDQGWLVIALDPLAFSVTHNMTDFCGDLRGGSATMLQESFSVTEVAGLSVPGNSQRHPEYRNLVDDSDLDLSVSQSDEISDFDADDSSASNPEDIPDDGEVVPSMALPDTAELVEALPEPQEEDESTSNDQDHDQDRFSRNSASSSPLSSVHSPASNRQGRHIRPFISSVEEGEQELHEYGGGFMTKTVLKRNRITSASAKRSNLSDIPLLHGSVSHLRLFNAPVANEPHWFCADLLTQLVPDLFAHTRQYNMERLNMAQQIPELGIVVIASQSGRCAICSMTRLGRSGPFGLRVDWVLPTKNEEKAGKRPLRPLLGIAVGPIQGMMQSFEDNADVESFADRMVLGTPTSFDTEVVLMDSSSEENNSSNDEREAKRLKSPSKTSPVVETQPSTIRRHWTQARDVEAWRGVNYGRRYRLMMTYDDWTVLTYEISREAAHIGLDATRKNYRNRSSVSMGHHYGPYSEE